MGEEGRRFSICGLWSQRLPADADSFSLDWSQQAVYLSLKM